MPITLMPASTPSLHEEPQPVLPRETRLDRLLKLLPSEVLLAYPALIALCGREPLLHLTVTLAGMIAGVLSLVLDARTCGLRCDWRQHVVRSLAFLAWAMVLGNPLGRWLDGAEVRRFATFLTLGIPVAGYLLLSMEPEPDV